MSTRTDLARDLKRLCPRGWVMKKADDSLEEVAATAIVVSQRVIEPAPNFAGNHRVTFRVFIVDKHAAADAAEDSLDSSVDDVLFALDSIDYLFWTSAEKVIYQGRRAYQITVQAFSEKKAKD